MHNFLRVMFGLAAFVLLAGTSYGYEMVKVAYAYWSAPNETDTYLVIGTDKGEAQLHALTGKGAHERILDGCYKVATYSLINKVPVRIYQGNQSVGPGTPDPGPFSTTGSIQASSIECSIVNSTITVPREAGTPE